MNIVQGGVLSTVWGESDHREDRRQSPNHPVRCFTVIFKNLSYGFANSRVPRHPKTSYPDFMLWHVSAYRHHDHPGQGDAGWVRHGEKGTG